MVKWAKRYHRYAPYLEVTQGIGPMTTLELPGRITERGDLELRLPKGLPAGEVTVRIEVPDDSSTWEQQPWIDEEIRDMLKPQRSTFKQLVKWLDANPPTEPWGGLRED